MEKCWLQQVKQYEIPDFPFLFFEMYDQLTIK